MPRFSRCPSPGALHHLIARFVNRAYRFTGPPERQEYLRRLGRSLEQIDWTLLGYALMSNHIHLLAIAGSAPPRQLMQPLQSGFAHWLNRRQGTLGPVFADRFKSIVCPLDQTQRLLAYIHNNPVRAALVDDPSESDWTSHQAYLGQVNPPPWLAVSDGLRICGFGGRDAARAFHHMVLALRSGRDAAVAGADMERARRLARRACGAAVELGTGGGVESLGIGRYTLMAKPATPLRPRWEGAVEVVLDRVAAATGISVDRLRAREQVRAVVQARRLAMLVWAVELGRAQAEMAAAVGLSAQGGSALLRRAPEQLLELRPLAHELAAQCWAAYP